MATAIQPNSSKKKTPTDIAERIQPASKAVGPFKAVFYGRNKQGKTHLAGSSNLKTLIIDCNEKGFETVRNRPNVDVYELENFLEESDLYWWAKAGKHPYELFVFDTVSSLATVCMKHVMGEASRDTSVDPAMPDKRHWGKVAQLMNNVIINWRNLPYNIIFLAQERRWVEEDEEGNEETTVEVTPSLSKAPLQTLLSAVGTIGRIYVREATVKDPKTKQPKTVMEHRLLLGPHPIFMAGTRIKGIPRVMREPTLQQILDKRDQAGELPAGEATHGLEI